MERGGEWELERLLLEWGKSGQSHLQGQTRFKIGLRGVKEIVGKKVLITLSNVSYNRG